MTRTRTIHTTTRDVAAIAPALADALPFRTSGALYGEPYHGIFLPPRGYLPADWRDAMSATGVAYVVMSYGTPIAWRSTQGTGEWYVPRVGYSMTTSKHQGTIRRALAAQGIAYTETIPA